MSKGGELLIKTELVVLSEAAVGNHHGERTGEFILLTVRDTGCGIPSEILPHIFEPFFTTKEVDKGTGLGLATVFGIIQQHQGWVKVESKVNSGTSFKVYLPSASSLPKAADAQGSLPSIVGGSESVLLVEDERTLRWAARHSLQRLGYTVFEAASSMEALAVWKEQEGRIDLLLTDIVMPDAMLGRELASQLRAQKPQLRVIFTSGYNLDRPSADFISSEDGCFLPKPYEPRRLAEIVRQCLDKAPSRFSQQEGNKPIPVAAHARKLIIVDDNPALRLAMTRGLRPLGFETIACDNGIDGFQLAREHVPDLIISDINMERGDGYSLLARLRQDPLLANIPVILLTGQGDSEGMRSGMEHGADDYLTKPFEIAELRAAVQARLARRQAGDSTRHLLVKTLEATTDLVCIARLADYQVVHLNLAGRKLTGVRTTEHLDSFHLEDIYSRKAWATLREAAIPQAITRGVWSGELHFVNRSGDEIPASHVLLVHADSAGSPEHISIVARDLSERIHFERGQAELQSKLRDLTGRLDSAQQEDRGRIARLRKMSSGAKWRDEVY